MKKYVAILFVLTLFATGCKEEQKLKKFSFRGETMGSYYAVTYYAENRLVQQKEVEALLQTINKSLSTWDKNSLISAINNAQSKHITDSFFRQLFNTSKNINTISKGAFDPTASPLFEAWGFGLKNAENLDSTAIDSILRYVGIEKFKLLSDTIYKPYKNSQISFNAIAPGYAADLIGKLLLKNDITNYLVDVGGEFASHGIKPDSSKWTVGIEQPIENKTRQNKAQSFITLENGECLATSGNYRKFYYKKGKKYSHTINPITGFPVNHNLLSVTIVTDNATTADAYATTCMVLGLEAAKEFVKQQNVKAYFIYDSESKLSEYITENLKYQFSK